MNDSNGLPIQFVGGIVDGTNRTVWFDQRILTWNIKKTNIYSEKWNHTNEQVDGKVERIKLIVTFNNITIACLVLMI